MNLRIFRWPIAGALTGALCLGLATTPVLAHPDHDEDQGTQIQGDSRDEDSGDQVRKEIRVYRKGDGRGDGDEAQVRGAYLGVRVQDVSRELQKAKELPTTQGALINRVEPGSPAAEAGLRRGDVILEIDRDQIDNSMDLVDRVQGMDPGSRIQVTIRREGMRKTLSVTVAKRPKEFTMIAPHFDRHWFQQFEGDMPGMPDHGDQLERIRVYRHDIQRQLDQIQKQLTRLREGDLQRLEEEIRSLREELRVRDQERSPGKD